MSESVRGIVVSHAGLSASLVTAVEAIAGPCPHLVPVSNEGCDRHAIAERIAAAAGDASTVVLFVDLPGGSCHAAAARLHRDRPGWTVIAGVNLPMLLDFAMHARDDPAAAAARAADAGARAITVIAP